MPAQLHIIQPKLPAVIFRFDGKCAVQGFKAPHDVSLSCDVSLGLFRF